MPNIDTSLFYNAKSSGMVLDEWRLTDVGHAKVFNVANSGYFPAVSIEGFKAIKACYYSEQLGIHGINIREMDTNTYKGACQASTPWKLGNTAALLFPDKFQPWEADNEAYMEEYKNRYSLTYQGEIAFTNYLKEAESLLERYLESINVKRPLMCA
jgi:hypothetical protein